MGAYWVLFIAALLLLLQAYLFRRFALSRLQYSRVFQVTTCYAGDAVELIERIENKKALPVPWLRVESQFRSGLYFKGQPNLDVSEGEYHQNHKSFFSLMPWTRIIRRHQVIARQRGVYVLGTVSMTAGDLIGMAKVVRSHQMNGVLYVYPIPLDISQMELPVKTWMGDMLVKRWLLPDPFQTSGIREYREGDDVKDIHWKASARSGELQVYRKEATADSRIMIYLNVEDHEHMWSRATHTEALEYGVSLAAGIAVHLLSQGMVVGFGSNGTTDRDSKLTTLIPAGGGPAQCEDILAVLAALDFRRAGSFHDYLEMELPQSGCGHDIVLLTSYKNEKLERLMDQYRQDGYTIQLLTLDNHSITKQEVQR
ncbi:DUF58 domain-containing protein [Paenibacillus sp. JSM ZJ436]|uniref:DUF58 domain-containing protein n=1 Tax=Paenibacillus sp. JSM ZJ436 TaxID=3376190 RepID=UPI0037A0103B